jgi:hypothetical protein
VQEVRKDLGVLQPRTLLHGFVAGARLSEVLQYEIRLYQLVQPRIPVMRAPCSASRRVLCPSPQPTSRPERPFTSGSISRKAGRSGRRGSGRTRPAPVPSTPRRSRPSSSLFPHGPFALPFRRSGVEPPRFVAHRTAPTLVFAARDTARFFPRRVAWDAPDSTTWHHAYGGKVWPVSGAEGGKRALEGGCP